MAKGEYKNTMQKLGEMLKTEPAKTPIQEVRPVEEPTQSKVSVKATPEVHINFWVPDELMQQLKIHAAISKKTIKQIGIEAFEAYLSNHKK